MQETEIIETLDDAEIVAKVVDEQISSNFELKLDSEIKQEYDSCDSDSEFEFQFALDDNEYEDVMKRIRASDSDIEEVGKPNQELPTCNICNKSFARKYNLERHLLTHRDDRSFVCETCGKTIRGTLSLHQKLHTDEKPFRCDVCGRLFRQRLGLKSHMMIHSGEKPFQCNICSKKFRQKQSLQHHMPRHTGERSYTCDQCGRSFSEKSSLQKHAVIHSDFKPYQCDSCDQMFKHKSSLVRHKKVHTRVTECHICGRIFRYESFLAKHFKNAHMNEMIEEQPESNEQFQVIQMTDVSTTSDLTIPMQDLDSQPHTIIQIQAPMVTHNAYTYTPIDRQNPNIQTIHLRYSS